MTRSASTRLKVCHRFLKTSPSSPDTRSNLFLWHDSNLACRGSHGLLLFWRHVPIVSQHGSKDRPLPVDCLAAFLDILRQEVTIDSSCCTFATILFNPRRWWLRVIFDRSIGLFAASPLYLVSGLCQKNCMLSLVNFHVHLLSPSDMKLHAKQILTWPENC